jgi:hypothetical protein
LTVSHSWIPIFNGDAPYRVSRAWVLLPQDALMFGTIDRLRPSADYSLLCQHTRWYPLITTTPDTDFAFNSNRWWSQIWTNSSGVSPRCEYLIALDGAFPGCRMPYPIPPVAGEGADPEIGQSELATVTNLGITGQDWTIGAHVAFPEEWDSYWAATVEQEWPLFEIQSPAATLTIVMRRQGTDPTQLQSIVLKKDLPTPVDVALPFQFWGNSGSPIWIAVSQQSGANRLWIAARTGGGDTALSFLTGAAGSPASVDFGGGSPLLIFSVVSDTLGRDGPSLEALLSGPLLITGSET